MSDGVGEGLQARVNPLQVNGPLLHLLHLLHLLFQRRVQ
jgi:hypothetical protein